MLKFYQKKLDLTQWDNFDQLNLVAEECDHEISISLEVHIIIHTRITGLIVKQQSKLLYWVWFMNIYSERIKEIENKYRRLTDCLWPAQKRGANKIFGIKNTGREFLEKCWRGEENQPGTGIFKRRKSGKLLQNDSGKVDYLKK